MKWWCSIPLLRGGYQNWTRFSKLKIAAKVEISVIEQLWHYIYKDHKGLINIAKNIMKVQTEIFRLFISSMKTGKRKAESQRQKSLKGSKKICLWLISLKILLYSGNVTCLSLDMSPCRHVLTDIRQQIIFLFFNCCSKMSQYRYFDRTLFIF